MILDSPRTITSKTIRIIPVKNIAELLEYVLLPYNDDVTKPRTLNTFLDRLAKIGIVLSDLIEEGYRHKENTFENESNVESSLDRKDEGE